MYERLTQIENDSIRAFVQRAADEGYVSGIVLDYGCGRQPYRDIVEGIKPFGGPIYQPFDQAAFPANMSGKNVGEGDPLTMLGWGTILCTQVIQFVPLYPDEDGLEALLIRFRHALESKHGHLVLTYPTNWPEVNEEDLHRFTKMGMERLLTDAGFTIIEHERRAAVRVATGTWETDIQRDLFALGYGVIARA